MKLIKESLKVNNIKINNRIVMPPMATSKSDGGKVNQNLVDYYDEKSKGGYIGLIITEHAFVSKEGMANSGQVSISNNNDIEGLKKIVDAIHNNGSKVIAQISHAGSSANPKVTGLDIISASAVVNNGYTGKTDIVPNEMNKNDISRVVKCFVDASRRAKEAGFDGVEIHSAHGYLLNQFYSPLTNKRSDEYGGSLENRIKIHLDIIKEVRKVVGEEYLIALRLGVCDYVEGGSSINDAIYASKAFENEGLDLLDISGGFCGILRPGHNEPGYFGELSEAIKKEVSIPVILTGGITEGIHAESLLKEGKADLVGVGRAILKDSNWAKKVME